MRSTMFGGAVALMIVFTGCSQSAPTADPAPYPAGPITMTAGANPGSGLDLTIRSVVDAVQKEKIVDVALPVENRPGHSGADFLTTMVEERRGDDDQVASTSLSMMVNQVNGTSEYGFGDVTMIARLMTEYYIVVTRPGSRFVGVPDVMGAVRADPAGVAVGAAFDDEAPFDLLVTAAGGDPSTVRYVTEEGGGEQIAALEDGSIDVAIGGVSEFVDQLSSGTLTALGVLAENRVPGLDAPTAREQGLDVTLSNWRGLYGPPDMPTNAVEYWQSALRKMVESPAWVEIAERSKFTTTFMVGDEFRVFLTDTQKDVEAVLRPGPR
ncbi:Bug family tripartite tricarboxylate transporter substrate binding protein [Actinomycetes bacterium M1A6_2h]